MYIMKRWLALLLSAAILFTAVPLSVFAQNEEADGSVNSESVTVEGNNGFGELLSEDLMEYQTTQEEDDEDLPGGFAIVDVAVEGNTATVEYGVTEEANLVVSIYTEDGLQMLLSGNTLVSPDDKTATVVLEGTMPQYFMASAYLVDTFDYSPLCEAYSTPMYTREMQELLASDIYDYDQDLVLNLDDSTHTNFAVYADGTIQIDAVPGVNTVVSVDDENATYVIENADSAFTSLRVGDVFSYAYGDNEFLIAKVAAIDVDGTTVTIIGGDLEMEEVFSHVKLESAESTPDFTVDDSNLEEGVVCEGVSGDVQTFAWDETVSSKRYIDYTLDKEIKTTAGVVEMSAKVSGTLRVGIETSLNYYISLKRQYVEFKSKLLLDLAVGISAEIDAKIPLGIYHISLLECIGIGLEPVIQIKASAEITFRVTYSGTFGFRFEDGSLHNISTPPDIEHEVEMEGTIFIGLNLNPSIFLFGGAVMDVTMEIPFGFELKVKQTGTDVTGIEDNATQIHGCTSCLEGTISIKEEISLKVRFLKAKKLTFGGTIFSHTFKLGTFYWSIEHGELGWGACPYEKYRVSVYVKGSDGNALPLVDVIAKGKDGPYDTIELGQTNANGILSCYLAPNTYDFVVKDNGEDVVATIQVKEPRKIYLNCNQISTPDILFGEVSTGTLIESSKPSRSGSCGNNVKYEFYNFGLLKISGTGPMADYSSENEQPWYSYADSVTMVVIEDGVTSVGSYAFAFCRQMKTLEIPDSVTKINPFAFQWCLGLTSLTIPSSVTTIYGYAFYGCSGLTELVIPNSIKEIGMYAFAECNGLTEIYLPASVTRLGDTWLASDKLMGYTVDPNNPSFKSIDGVLYNKSGTTLMLIPGQYEGVYHIPSGVTHIAGGAFECQAQLTEVYIPDTVTLIGHWAFKDCRALETVVFQGDAPTIADEAFYGWDAITAYYPAGNETWTADKMQNYGGTITWVAYDPTTAPISADESGADSIAVTEREILGDLGEKYENTSTTEENGEISTFGLWGGDYETEQTPDYDLKTATFSGLVAGEQYLMLSLVSIEVEDLLAPSNLLYVAQGTAAADGTLRITYVQRVDTELSYVIACGASHKNLKDATITFPTMVATDVLQVVEPTVMYGGKKLEEGVDYTISGVADYTKAGTYTCYIRGIYNYSGRVKCQYTVVELPISGSCGDALTWTLNEDGILTISGSGTMTEFPDDTSAPWYACRDLISEVIVSKGVESVSNYAFAGCTKLLKVSFLGNAPDFGEKAFAVVGFTANYPMYDPSWTDDVKKNYGGSVAWTGVEYPCEHINTEVVNAKSATCQETGYSGDTVCKDCYKTVITGSVLTKAAHNYDLNNVCVDCGASKPILTVASGKCGTSLTWVFKDNGMLTITGSGTMNTYSYGKAPWYEYREQIKYISLSSRMTSITNYAFADCSALTSAEVPSSVTSIGSAIFRGCTSLKSITIPFIGSSSIAPSASNQYPLGYFFGGVQYDGCTATKQSYYGSSASLSFVKYGTYYIPDSLTSVTVTRGNILYGAFSNCWNLSEIRLGADVLSVQPGAFRLCAPSDGVWVEPTNSKICTDAAGVVYSKDMKTLIACPGNLEGNYTVAGTAEKIGQLAFDGCAKLTTVTIGSTVNEIGNYAFSNCTALTDLAIPASVTKTGIYVLQGCSSLESLTIPFVGRELKTPEDTYQYPIGEMFGITEYEGGIATEQLYYGSSISSSTESTYYIPQSLKSVTVMGGYILKGAFSNCSNLTDITLTDDVLSIEPEAFKDCTSLKDISIGAGITHIGNSAFMNCASLTALPRGENLVSYGDNAFNNCDGLTELAIDEKIVALGAGAFANCDGLVHAAIPETVTTVGSGVLSGCKNLETVTIGSVDGTTPENEITLSNTLFRGCMRLRSVTLGSNVSSVTATTFQVNSIDASNEQAIWVVEDNPYFSNDEYGVLYNKDKTVLIRCPGGYKGSFTVPDSVITIAEGAFWACHYLTDVTTGNNLTTIETQAFYCCRSLTAASLGFSVQKIDSGAFSGCDSLAAITIPASVREMGNVFIDCQSLEMVCFLGNAPTVDENLFYFTTTTVYYHSWKSGWYSVAGNNYGGTITWVSTTSPCQHKQTKLLGYVKETCTEPGYSGDKYCIGCRNTLQYGSEVSATDHWYQTKTIAATCAVEGSKIYTCRYCGDSYTETIAKLSHNYCFVVTAPTCTETGYTTYTCSVCGDTYTANETAMIPHNYEETLLAAPTCTTEGSMQYTCTGCSDSYTEVIDKLGHSHESTVTVPTCTEGGYTTYTCHCGDTYTTDYTEAIGHNYVGSICVNCGDVRLIKWVGTQLQATSSLDMQFALRASDLGDTTGNYIVLTRTYVDGTTDVVEIPQTDWTVSDNFYIVAYSGIAAKEMNDVVSAVVYNANGEVISETRSESIVSYSLSMLGKITNSEQRTMFVDMLNYGAEAQRYFHHNEDKLANADLTDEQKAWATQEDVVVSDNRVKDASVFGTQLSLENVVLLQAAFNPETSNGGNTKVEDRTCETAQELADNIIRGWNLGCSLSVASKTTVSSFAGLIGMSTDDGKYSRSEYLNFDEETNSVTLDWELGKDNGLLNASKGAKVVKIFVEQWNFSLSESDICTFTVKEFTCTLASGETISLIDAPVTQQTDMSGGTGAIYLVNQEELNGLQVEDIVSMHCVMSYGGMYAGEPTPEEIAAQEQAWGNPVTTQEMIDTVVDRGFNLIRIQVSYLNHMDAEGNIDELWLDRVQEVVDYCMNAGVYCVINTSGYMWMTCNPADWEVQKPIYTNLWKQISERFADYDEKLIFESCNEILYAEGMWNYPPAEAYDVMHEIHQTFVDTVRAGGGYNETRNLMLNPYAAGYDYEMNKNFTLPTDTVEGHLLAQVHCYVPQDFTFNETNLGSTNFRYEWGTAQDKWQLDETLLGIKKRFIDELGIPVVIGEFGIAKRLSESEAAEYIGFYAQIADKYDIQLILFDDGLDIAVFDRNNLTWTRPQVIETLFAEAASAGVSTAETVTDATTKSIAGMTAVVTYTNHRGVSVTETVNVEDNNGFAMVSVDSLAFADHETMVTITAYNADGTVIGSVTDSMASYAARANNTLAKSLMKFCASAYAYFH